MRSRIFQLGVIIVMISFLVGCGPSAVVVRTRPEPPVYVRPIAPGPGYIWIEGEWIPRGHGYVYRQGYWQAPVRRYHQYREGHWQKRRGGWYWVPGRWN
ncbi:MAG: hypothetical protein M3Z92_00565 [Bacteroidota bacterium]|nr:hypothetical protein [Bacteroidota bacterium]MDQ6889062.1 hypothetical protein [Bacteroidota bacterium]